MAATKYAPSEEFVAALLAEFIRVRDARHVAEAAVVDLRPKEAVLRRAMAVYGLEASS